MKPKIIQDVVDEIKEAQIENLCKKTCVPDYYKNQFLAYAMRHHNSVACILRTYSEMLVTYSKYFSHDATDLKHSNQNISYLQTYSNEKLLTFISNLFFSELRSEIMQKYPYLIMNFSGRLKSVRSYDAKERTKILTSKTLDMLLSDFPDHLMSYQELKRKNNPNDPKGFLKFSTKNLNYAKYYITNLKKCSIAKNPTKDCIGYRGIVDAFNYSRDEKVLIQFIYDLFALCKNFFQNRGYEIVEIKDYIKKPKPNNYQSLHFVVLINNLPVEVQLRTGGMHKVAEEGTANYHKIYKDTLLQNFLKTQLYEVSEKLDKVRMNQGIGLLECTNLPNPSIRQTPNSEIPKTPADLKEFLNLQLLEKIYAQSPRI